MASTPSMSRYLRYLLMPLVRFCVRHSIKLHDIVDSLKQLLLEAAEEELRRNKSTVTSSRLSLMTGVHRKDIHRLHSEPGETERKGDLITRIIGQWQGDRRFRTVAGAPRVLSFEGGEGDFARLVASVSREVSPYSIALELQRSGLTEQTRGGLKLVSAVYTPKGADESFAFLGQDMQDLISTVEENIAGRLEKPNLHMTTEYNNISPVRSAVIREWFLREGEHFHRRAREFLSKFDRDINPRQPAGGGRIRVALSSFGRIESLDNLEREEKSNEEA